MSDGPHRSLPMRRDWKILAERAAKPAYSTDQVIEGFRNALQKDLSEAPLAIINDILGGGPQGSLFPEERINQLEAARLISRGSATSNIVIDCAIEAVTNGLTGNAAFTATLESACEERASGNARSIVEHQRRADNASSASYVQGRLEEAKKQLNYGQVSSLFMSADKASPRPLRLTRRTGIDEGPALS